MIAIQPLDTLLLKSICISIYIVDPSYLSCTQDEALTDRLADSASQTTQKRKKAQKSPSLLFLHNIQLIDY